MPAQTTIPSKTITIEGHKKIFHDKTRFNHKRSPTQNTRRKTQPKEVGYFNKNTIDGLTVANLKGENVQVNITNNEN